MVETKIADPSKLHYYYYEHAAEEEKGVYERLLKGYYNMTEEISLEDFKITSERLKVVKKMVLYDHPELFWTNGTISYTTSDDVIKKVYLEFTMNSSQRKSCQIEIDQAMAEYTKVLRGRMKDYDAALKIYVRMINLLDYDSVTLEQVERNQKRGMHDEKQPDHLRSVYGALVMKKAVCAGYAKGFQYIIQSLGIECLSVVGPCKGLGAHQWNIIRLNGQYYHIDVTWGDHSNTDSSKSHEGVSYNYFCLTEKEIKKSRSIDPLIPVPHCSATKCNYFRLKNVYIQEYDLGNLISLVRNQLSLRKRGEIQIRFASAAMMNKAERELFTEKKIFKILDEIGETYNTVWHNKDKDLYILKLWTDKRKS